VVRKKLEFGMRLAIRKRKNPAGLGQLAGVEPNALFCEQIQFAAQGGPSAPAHETARRQVGGNYAMAGHFRRIRIALQGLAHGAAGATAQALGQLLIGYYPPARNPQERGIHPFLEWRRHEVQHDLADSPL